MTAVETPQRPSPTKKSADALEDLAIRFLDLIARTARELELLIYAHRVSHDAEVQQRLHDVQAAHKNGEPLPSLSADEAVDRIRNKTGF